MYVQSVYFENVYTRAYDFATNRMGLSSFTSTPQAPQKAI